MLEWNTPFIDHIGLPPWRDEDLRVSKVTAVLKVIPKGEFHKSFWQYAKCTAAQGIYSVDEGNLVTPFMKPYV